MAVETADIVLVRSNPLDVVAIIELSRATYRKMIQNLVWATGYNVATLATAVPPSTMYGAPASPGMSHLKMGSPGSMAAMDPRMKTMQEMHQKMMDASAPTAPKQRRCSA